MRKTQSKTNKEIITKERIIHRTNCKEKEESLPKNNCEENYTAFNKWKREMKAGKLERSNTTSARGFDTEKREISTLFFFFNRKKWCLPKCEK